MKGDEISQDHGIRRVRFALLTALTIRLTVFSLWWLVAVIIFIFVWGGYFRGLGEENKE